MLKQNIKCLFFLIIFFCCHPVCYFLAGWAGEREPGSLLIMQMSEDVCVKILCGNISEFIELFTRLLVYYFGDLSFDVHIFKIFIFGNEIQTFDLESDNELGHKHWTAFFRNRIFCMEYQFEATSCFWWNKPICYSILWLNIMNKFVALTIHQQTTIFRTITKIIIQFVKEVLFCKNIFYQWSVGLIEMH